MKISIKNIFVIGLMAMTFFACKREDEEGEMKINFKSGGEYISSSQTVSGNSELKIGIEAETEKAKDPIIKFNISESVNGGSDATVYSQDLENTSFNYEYNFTLNDTVPDNTHKYTFTVTNRDGFNEQVSLTVTVE